jgi:flagellar basal body-associated protein FliL
VNEKLLALRKNDLIFVFIIICIVVIVLLFHVAAFFTGKSEINKKNKTLSLKNVG